MATPSNAEICAFFFKPVFTPAELKAAEVAALAAEEAAALEAANGGGKSRKKRGTSSGANRHRCRVCGNVYTQNASTGYTNLMTHLRIKHMGWEDLLHAQNPDAAIAQAASASTATKTKLMKKAPAPATVAKPATPASIAKMPMAFPLPVQGHKKSAAGRKRGPIYAHFVDMPEEEMNHRKGKRMRCRYCLTDTPQLSARLKSHIVQCQVAPEAVKLEFANDVTAAGSKRANADPNAGFQATGTNPVAFKKPKFSSDHTFVEPPNLMVLAPKPTLHNARDRGEMLRSVEEKLTEALVATGAPWTLLDNVQFREVLQLLQPTLFPVTIGPDFPLSATRARMEVVERLAQQYDNENRNALTRVAYVTLVVDATSSSDALQSSQTRLLAVDEWRRAFLLTVQPYAGDDAPAMTELLTAASTLPLAPNTRISLCCATAGDLADTREQVLRQPSTDTGVTATKSFALVGTCLAQQSNLLLRDLVESCPAATHGAVGGLEEALNNALAISDALRTLPTLRRRVMVQLNAEKDVGQPELERGLTQGSPKSWRSIAIALKRTTRLDTELRLAVELEKEATDGTLTPEADEALRRMECMGEEDSVWATLRLADELLAPLHYVSALSEMPQTTSGQLLALWLWVFGSAVRSPLVDGDAFAARFLRRLQCYGEDHAVACLMLDPRVHGVGLNATGQRRARGVAVRVASALLPELDEASFMRSYSDYMKKEGDFGEPGVWNPANTASPLQFWGDYEGDPRHTQLATVAKAVCTFMPVTSSTETHWASRIRRRSAVTSNANNPEQTAQQEKLAKVRAANAARSQPSVMAIMDKYETLLDVDNVMSVGLVLQVSSAEESTDDLDWEVIAPRGGGNRKLCLRSVLDSFEDGLEEDVNDDAASTKTTSGELDASCIDTTPAGLARVHHAMNTFMQASGTV